MNEDTLNMATRKFLKKVGVTSQREIEQAVYKAIESGDLKGSDSLEVRMTLSIPALDISHQIDGEISLE